MSSKSKKQEEKVSNILYSLFRFIFVISWAVIRISLIIIISFFAGLALQKTTRSDSPSDYRKRIQGHFKR